MCQVKTVPSSSDEVETHDGTSASDQPDPDSLSQESESWDNRADTKEKCLVVTSMTALQTKTIEKVNNSKTVPLKSLSAHRFEDPVSLRSQDWLSGMDEASSYSPYCTEGLSISDCIEEIVPIDEIDSYVEEVRRAQSKRTSCRTGSSPQPVSNSETHYTNRNSHEFQEADLNEANVKKLNSSCSSANVNVLSTARNPRVNAASNAPVLNQIEGAVEPLGGASIDASIRDEAVRAADDAFCDYDSDDENFEAELQQWQQSAVGLLNQAQKKGTH